MANPRLSRVAFPRFLLKDDMNRREAILRAGLAGFAGTGALRAQPVGPKLTEVYQNNNFQFTGISVSKAGRIFVNFPRWSAEYLNAVVEVMPDGSAKPYPDEDWNRWNLSPETASKHFICVQSVVVDANDSLWVLDAAAPMLMSIVPGGPKLVQVDLKTNQVKRTISIPPEVAKTSTYLNDVRFDNERNFAYITDSGLGGIIVVNLASGESYRHLDGDSSVMPDKNVKIVIDGKPLLGPTGETPAFHSDAIALSPDKQYVYYQPIAKTSLYRVATEALRDKDGRPKPEVYVKTLPVDGIWMDSRSNIYLTDPQKKGISVVGPNRTVKPLLSDPRLQWPDTLSEGPDGSIYVTASHINDSPTYNKGKSVRTMPYQAFKFQPV